MKTLYMGCSAIHQQQTSTRTVAKFLSRVFPEAQVKTVHLRLRGEAVAGVAPGREDVLAHVELGVEAEVDGSVNDQRLQRANAKAQ